MRARKTGKNTLRGLHGLRTIALVGVLLFHMVPKAVPGGYFGVVFFFVLSGFLTAYSYASGKNSSVISYYLKRLKRIYPSMILMIFISLAVIALVDHYRLANAGSEVPSILFAYNNYWQISQSADYFANLSANSAFTHLWYISILIQFELLFPWLYRLCDRFGRQHTLGILALISLFIMPVLSFLPSVSKTQLYYDTFCRIHALLIGAWCGWSCQQTRKRHSLRPIISIPCFMIFLGITLWLMFHGDGQQDWVYHFGLVFYALLSCLILRIVISDRTVLGRFLDQRICSFISKYSYEIYLWQYPVLFVASLSGIQLNVLTFLLETGLILLLSMWTNWIVYRLLH